MQYDVVSSDALETLIAQVNKKLGQGWDLQGGICVCAFARVSGSLSDGDGSIDSNGDYEYAQAIVRREDFERTP